MVLYTIASFEVFDLIYVMVPSGVGNSTQVIVTQIYQNGFQQFRYGVAAAQAFILFLMIATRRRSSSSACCAAMSSTRSLSPSRRVCAVVGDS